jgi:hypothetical protein
VKTGGMHGEMSVLYSDNCMSGSVKEGRTSVGDGRSVLPFFASCAEQVCNRNRDNRRTSHDGTESEMSISHRKAVEEWLKTES